jgi:hypothetical protein
MNWKSMALTLALAASASPAAAWESPEQAAYAFCRLLTNRSDWKCYVEPMQTRIIVYQTDMDKLTMILGSRLLGESFCLTIKESMRGGADVFSPGWRINVLAGIGGLVLMRCPLSEADALESVPPPQALQPLPAT